VDLAKQFHTSQVTIPKRSGRSSGPRPHPAQPRWRSAGSGERAGRSHSSGKREAAPQGEITDCGRGRPYGARGAGGDSRFRDHHHGNRAGVAQIPEPYHHYQCRKYCRRNSRVLPLRLFSPAETLRKNSFSLVGPIAEETLRRLNGDILFLGVDGFDVQHGLTTPNLLEAKVNRAMMDVARLWLRCATPASSGDAAYLQLLPPSGVHYLINGPGCSQGRLGRCKENPESRSHLCKVIWSGEPRSPRQETVSRAGERRTGVRICPYNERDALTSVEPYFFMVNPEFRNSRVWHGRQRWCRW